MKSQNARKLRWKHMRDVIRNKCNQADGEKILITVASMQADLGEMKDIQVTKETIRDNGFCNGGPFERSYDSTKYRSTGDPNRRGLVVKTDEFLQEVES